MKQFCCLLLFVFLTHLLVAQDCNDISGEISPSSSDICEGGSVLLTATGGSSYEWSLNGIVIDGETGSTFSASQAGTYSVVIIEGECRVPASNTADVDVNPVPRSFIFPATSAICEGGSTRLTVTGGNSYTWFLNGEEINGENRSTLDATEPGTYSVVIRQGDCSAEALNTAEVTRTASPTGTISPAAISICQGSSTMLTATGGTSYTWFRNGNQVFGQTGETITVLQGGTYSVVIHQGDCSGEASNTAVVTVTPAPSGNISPAVSSVCFGGSVELTATGGSSYTWFRNGDEIDGETGSTLTATQGGLYTARIHNGDCSAQASNASLVTILPTPVGGISPATGSLCEDETMTLTATGGTSYTWFRNGDEISGETGARLEISEPGTYSAIIRQGTCTGPATNTSVITRAAAPSGSISPASGSICPGGAIVLTATGGTSYTWYRNGNIIQRENDATLTVTRDGTYTATIRQGNCSAPASNSVEITIASAPTGTISPASATFCEGGGALLAATGGTSYIWYRNGSLIQGENGSTLNATKPGTYTVTINQGECSGPASNSSVVTVSNTPTGSISPENAVICGDGSVVLTATGGTSYTWLRDDVVIDGQQSQTLTVTQAGAYKVIIKNGTCEGPGSNTVTVVADNTRGTRYADVYAKSGATVQLEARDIGVSYEWTPPAGLSIPTSRTPTVTADAAKEYIVLITTANGCVVSDTAAIKLKSSEVFVPTGFTPNRNGKNDLLKPMGGLRSIESFKVFNRWGQLVFQTMQLDAGWDGTFKGTPQPSDSYTWLLFATGQDGKQIKLSGKTLLIR